jgi:RNA polymerase sigma-70 factor (ECF subfamily)
VTIDGDEERRLADAVLQAGDESAFRTLYRLHTPSLYRLALRLGQGDEVWAEELVQRTWIRVVAGLNGFSWQSAFRTWLIGIALNCAKELWRSGRGSIEVGLDRAENAAAPAGDVGLQVDLERAIARLPGGAREIFILHDIEGFTHEEIARMLGVSAGTSKSQLFEARQRLRQLLANRGLYLERRGGA